MKKILLFIFITLFLCGCNKIDIDSISKKFNDKVNNAKSYNLIGTMNILGDEENYTYLFDVSYKEDNLYKVILNNQNNDYEQILMRNKDGVYVVTPELNKSFKFESTWPLNSSQSYILISLLNDINNDNNKTLKEKNGMYIIKTKVNYPNNDELKYQYIYFDKNINLKKVVVYDNENNERIITEYSKVNLKAQYSDKDFNLDDYITNESCTSNCEEVTGSFEDIIYPLYLPGNTYLTSSEEIDTDSGKRVILTFSGDKDFTIIEESNTKSKNFLVEPVYGDPVFLNNTLGIIKNNSIDWNDSKVSYYLTSNNLTNSEMTAIANSMSNAKSVLESK